MTALNAKILRFYVEPTDRLRLSWTRYLVRVYQPYPLYGASCNCSGVKDIIAWCQVIAGGSHQDSAMYRIIYNSLGERNAYEIFSKFKRNDRNTRHDLIRNDKNIRIKYPKIDTILSTIIKLKDAAKKKSTVK